MFQSTYPWDDHGDEVVLDKVIAPNVIGQPFEVFFERPCIGYGYMFVASKGSALKFPKGKGSAYSGGGAARCGIGDGVCAVLLMMACLCGIPLFIISMMEF